MSDNWFYAPPDIEGWHEEGFSVYERTTQNATIVCRDCRNEEAARLIASAPDLLEAAKEVLDSPAGSPDYIAIDGLRRAVLKAQGNE